MYIMDIVAKLRDLTPDINTLPYERFCDIWQQITIINYDDIKFIKTEIPELKNYINSCVTIINFQGEFYDEVIRRFPEEDENAEILSDIYPHLDYVDNLKIVIKDDQIEEIRQQEYFRNVSISSVTKDESKIESYYDLIIDIIARNKGECSVSLTANHNAGVVKRGKTNVTTGSKIYSVNYNNGMVRIDNNLYLIDKIIQLRPEKMIFRLPKDSFADVLSLTANHNDKRVTF